MLFNIVGKRCFSMAKTKTPKLNPTGMHEFNPYVLFVKEQMKQPSSDDVQTRMKQIAKNWNAMNAIQKKKYETLAKEGKEKRIEEFENLSQKEKEQAVAKQKETREERAKRRERKERREFWESTDHPQRPASALNLFIQQQFEMRKKNNESVTPVTDYLKKFAAEWKEMSDEKKKVYTEKAKAAADSYKIAVDEWKKKQKQVAKTEKASA